MHLAVSEELHVLQPGDQAKDALLLRVLQIGLKADEIVQIAGEVVLPELDYRVGPPAGAGIPQADGPHGTECERVLAPFCDDLHRKTAFKEVAGLDAARDGALEAAQLNALRSDQGVHKCVVLPRP